MNGVWKLKSAVTSRMVSNICRQFNMKRTISNQNKDENHEKKRIGSNLGPESTLTRNNVKSGITVCVEGNIASGKTSFLNYFKNISNVEIFEEPVKRWRNIKGENALAKLYEDPTRWSLTLQTYVQLTMLEQHQLQTDKNLKMMERSIYSAKYCFVENLYKSGLMPPLEYTVLTEWYDWIIRNHNCNVDLIVYLKTDPQVVHDRIKQRGRKEEQIISLSYLQTLHDLHEDWLIHGKKFKSPAQVLILDANQEMAEMHRVFEDRKKEILCGCV